MRYEEIAGAADYFMKLAKKLDPGAKVRNRGTVVFPADHPKVKDEKDHFPINNEDQARNALARANQYKKAPKWYSGSLQSLVSAVAKKVHSKYKGIEISEAAKKPGKGATSNPSTFVKEASQKQIKCAHCEATASDDVFERCHCPARFMAHKACTGCIQKR